MVIPDGVQEIGDSAFNPYLDGLSLKYYEGRRNIKSVRIPEGTQRIGRSAFANCVDLKKLIAPKSVIRIDAYAFDGTAWLKNQNNHVIVNSVYLKYKGAEKLSKIRISASTKKIQANAFNGCKKLTIYAPEGCRGANLAKKNKMPVVAE